MKKGQMSAWEYLITYGWAILIILVVLAVLLHYDVFNPCKWSTTDPCFNGFDANDVCGALTKYDEVKGMHVDYPPAVETFALLREITNMATGNVRFNLDDAFADIWFENSSNNEIVSVVCRVPIALCTENRVFCQVGYSEVVIDTQEWKEWYYNI